jgi:hypothetical protein
LDQIYHGERDDGTIHQVMSVPQVAKLIFQVAVHTKTDIETLIQYFKSKEYIDDERIGMKKYPWNMPKHCMKR